MAEMGRGQATLPLSRILWGTAPTGWTDSGTTTYGTNCDGTMTTNGSGKLDDTGDNYKINFTGTPGILSLGIKGESTSGSYSVRIQESINGTTWTDLEVFNSGNPLNTSSCVTKNYNLISTTTYVRFLYETKVTGNVRVDDVSITAGCTPPNTSPSGFSTGNIMNTSMDVNWTNGNGTDVLVVARAGSAVNSDPVSGTSYTANAAFGSGSQIGTNNFVVYKGTGSTVNVTSLLAGTQYHYAIYAFNSADNCYNTTELAGNATTTAPPPVITHTGTSPAASNFNQGSNGKLLYTIKVDVATTATTLNQVIASSDGTWENGDLVNFKLLTNTTNTLTGASTLSTLTNPNPGSQSFTGLTQAFAIGTRYLFITCDVATGATINNTVSAGCTMDANLSYNNSPNYSSSIFASANTNTFIGNPEIQLDYPVGTNSACGTTTLDYGNIVVGQNSSLTFRIRNLGTADLNLTSLPLVITGTNSNQFSIIAQPTSPIGLEAQDVVVPVYTIFSWSQNRKYFYRQ